MGREVIPKGRDRWGGPPGGLGGPSGGFGQVERPSQRSGTGLEALTNVRVGSGGPLEWPRRVMRPSRWVGRPS